MKRIIVAVVVLGMIGFMVGCGEESKPQPASPPAKSEQKKTTAPAKSTSPAVAPAAKPAAPAKAEAAPRPAAPAQKSAADGKPAPAKSADAKAASTTGVGDVVDYGIGKTQLEIKKKKTGQVLDINADHNKKMNESMGE